MKKILWLSLGIVSIVFAENPANFSKTQKSVIINSQENFAEITITETWENQTEHEQNFRLIYPLSDQAKDFNFFVDSGARNFEILEGKISREKLFELAKTQKNEKWFGYANFPFSRLVFSENIAVPPRTNLQIKYQWMQNLDFITDFHLLPVFLADNEDTAHFSIKFTREGKIYHAISPFLNFGEIYKTENIFVWNWENSTENFRKNLFLFFSESPVARLEFPHEDFVYQANFLLPTAKNPPEKILFLIDASGSLYGEKWNRLGRILPVILQALPQESQIKIGFLNKNAVFTSTEFLPNQYENQKNWWEIQKKTAPSGIFDENQFLEILRSLRTKNPPIDSVVILGDFSDFSFPENFYFEDDFPRIMAFDFSKNEDFSFFIRRLNGQKINLFATAFDFPETEIFKNFWHFLQQKVAPPANPNAQDLLPETRDFFSQESQVFVSRTTENTQKFSPLADFLPSFWAQYQIAKHLKYFYKNGFEADRFEAMRSINRFFGLNFGWLEDLKKISEKDLWGKIWELEHFQPVFSDIFTDRSLPFYAGTALGFETQNLSKNTQNIAPFSEAQKQLFLIFPEIFSAPFSLGGSLQFCASFRCLKVSDNGQEEFDKSLLLYWKGYNLGHWGYSAAEILAQKNIIPMSDDGKIDFEKLISRGEFMRWTAEYFFENELKNFVSSGTPFPDLPQDIDQAKSILFLKNRGIVNGFSDGFVRSENTITRAEAVKILLALKGITPTAKPHPFSDLFGWEIPWISEAYEKKMVSGYPDGSFRPLSPINYAESAKLMVATK